MLFLPRASFAKRRFLQNPHGAVSQKTAFFIVSAVKTSNPTSAVSICKEDKNAEQQAKLQED
jgi:hypothetical protein